MAESDAGIEPAPSRISGARTALHSVRVRMVLRFAVALAIATVASILIQREALLSLLDRRINDDLTQEVTELRRLVGGRDEDGNCVGGRDAAGDCAVGRDPETGSPFNNDVKAVFDTFLRRNIPTNYEVMITFVAGKPYKVPGARSAVASDVEGVLFELADATSPARGEVDTEQGTLRYLAMPVAGTNGQTLGVFAVAQFVDLQRQVVDDELRVVALMGIVVLMVASVLAYVAAGRVLAPVRAVQTTARSISESDLSQRITVEGHDEIASLAHTFNDMLDRLQASFVTQRNFVDDASHELRTPITIIRGHLELLGDDPAERDETIAIVTDELDRMSRMVDDLLVLARAERPDFLQPAAVDVEPLTRDLLAKASTLAHRDWQLEQVGRGRIIADEQRLTQAVMQLAQNATQHTHEGDVVILGSAVESAEARLWVTDRGPGIPLEHQDRVFQRFARGGRTRSSEGAGLGLSIVRAIAEAHGGRVELRSASGAGATFTLVVPVDVAERADGDSNP